FSEARIRSHAKLSYEQVADFLQTPAAPVPGARSESLQALHAASACLQQQRQRDHIALPERAEYRARLDDSGKIASYQRQTKNAAHQLVEECMVATNRCAADFLQADGLDNSAVFVTHAGFRSERRDNIDKLIAAELPQLADGDIANLNDYVSLMKVVASTASELPLREILTRSLERSQFSATPAPHFGMGLPCYLTVTSPIRKFNDYLSQRAIKAKLRGEKRAAIGTETIARLQDCSDRARQAANMAQQWLDCDYLSKQTQATWLGTIVHVTSSGFLVRLNDNGIQGLVDTRRIGEKFSFDVVYMRLRSAKNTYQLEQQVEVKIAAIDPKKHQIAFALADTANGSTTDN
ncbi:MAG TPA: RNB domain-containing ribonuclease, partial [Spongiibacteraceae bacterium]|nr:RNB domain-containing ribonuclease [Spongiibacteraceae bacterium]